MYTKSLRENVSGKPVNTRSLREFERFRSDWGKKNEMYTGLIWFKLGLCDRDKV